MPSFAKCFTHLAVLAWSAKEDLLSKMREGLFCSISLISGLREERATQYCGAIILQFKKIRDTKGTFHAQMGTIKDRNCMDPTEAEDIKKRCQEYTEELYKKDLHDPYNHDGVITHLEPDILECQVKWALGSITRNKASELMELQLSYFRS